jgi:hypothetical protein
MMGILMGLYNWIGSLLVVKYLGISKWENLMYYFSDPFKVHAFIAGTVGGIFLQIGIGSNTRIRKVLYICGVSILLILAFYATILIISPE